MFEMHRVLKVSGGALVLFATYIAAQGLFDQLSLRVNTGFTWILPSAFLAAVGVTAYLVGDKVNV